MHDLACSYHLLATPVVDLGKILPHTGECGDVLDDLACLFLSDQSVVSLKHIAQNNIREWKRGREAI